MELGRLNKKASPALVIFVFGCIVIVIVLLYLMVMSERKGEELTSVYSYSLSE